MILLWITLYFGGRVGKATGRPEMFLLHQFMRENLNI
jgi:hypothetical protein